MNITLIHREKLSLTLKSLLLKSYVGNHLGALFRLFAVNIFPLIIFSFMELYIRT